VGELAAAMDGSPRSGRWPLLMWFARQERIMERVEVDAAIARWRAAHPIVN
jgi:hypothetical protein